MKIVFCTTPNFCRRLRSSEEAEYSDVLQKGRRLVSGDKRGDGKNILIVPAQSLPQSAQNNTGAGNLSGEESLRFFNFAKKYWGINEIQLLPMGQFHRKNGAYHLYSGTSMELGNHVIDIKSFIPREDYEKVVSANKIKNKVNYENIVDAASSQERVLKKLYSDMPLKLKAEFSEYKKSVPEFIEKKAIFRVLTDIYQDYKYENWSSVDANLFNEDVVSRDMRNIRIAEIKEIGSEEIDFNIFKQFLAEKSLADAKLKLNKMDLKLNADMICGCSYDEVWSYPKAFLKNKYMDWGFPIIDGDSEEGLDFLRKKVRFYAQKFDGIRVDGAWTYVSPNVYQKETNNKSRIYNNDKLLNLIEEEYKKIKGSGFDKRDLMYEFAADPKDFNVFDEFRLKPYLEDRMKVYTSDSLSEDFGSAKVFIDRGWDKDTFIMGMSNHDSMPVKVTDSQANVLSKLLKIPRDILSDINEFTKAKFAESIRAKHNMLFFTHALGIKKQYSSGVADSDMYRLKIPENYEQLYFKALQDGAGFNPMDALEKQFKAQGLDKSEPELYKKIVKFRKILESKQHSNAKYLKWSIGLLSAAFLLYICLRSNSYSSK